MELDNHSNLPEIKGNYLLSTEQIRMFQANGHIKLSQVATAEEIQAYEPVITQWVTGLNHHSKPVKDRDTYGKAFIQVENLWKRTETIARFTLAERFAKIAADLMGVNGVRLYHDQALYKEPGGGYTPWHQDQIYWPFDTDKTIIMWMPLVPISEQIGSMTFASGSQKKGYISKLVISDESHRTMAEYIEDQGMDKVTYGAMAAGDATFHAGWTLHNAPGNPTDTMRKVMTVIYIADGTRIMEPDNNARSSDLARWLPELKPGDIAASSLNPLVYVRGD